MSYYEQFYQILRKQSFATLVRMVNEPKNFGLSDAQVYMIMILMAFRVYRDPGYYLGETAGIREAQRFGQIAGLVSDNLRREITNANGLAQIFYAPEYFSML